MENKEENGLMAEATTSPAPEQGQGQDPEPGQTPPETGGEETTIEKQLITESPEKTRRPTAKEVAKKVVDGLFEEKKAKREFLRQYIERYPDNKTFHVTSDNMVFLEKDLSLARLHQKTLPEGVVDSITINK